MNPFIKISQQAAFCAGKIINDYFYSNERFDIEQKGINDFVSKVDKEAQQCIIEIISKYYPQHQIIGEEEEEKEEVNAENVKKNYFINYPSSEFVWIIDPLDGTTNFLHRLPHFSISIALMEKGKIKHGVIYNPISDEFFYASSGDGAYLLHRNKTSRLRVSTQTDLTNSILATGFPFRDFSNIDKYLSGFKNLMQKTSGIRRAGSAALDLAYTAAGRVDGFWEYNLSKWDIAAGIILVREAGGIVMDFDGGESMLETGDILAANHEIIKQIIAEI